MSRSHNTYGDSPKALRVDVLGLDSEIAYWTFAGSDELRVVVGSSPDCDWHVRGVGIAPHHLELVWYEDNLWARALAHPDGRPAPAGDWQQVDEGAHFDLGAMRVQVRAAVAEPTASAAPWIDAEQCATVITSASPGDGVRADTLSALPAVEPALDDRDPAGRRRPQGMMASHTAIVKPAQLRQWAAAVDSQPGQMAPVETPREQVAPQPARAAHSAAFDASATDDELGDSSVFAMPPPIEQGPPPVVHPPLWKTMWWAIPGRTVLILSAVAALVCFVWFPKLLSAEHDADGIQVRTRSIGAAGAVEARPALELDGVAHADEPELADDERVAAAYLVAGNYREALVAYRALAEAAPAEPAYAAMVQLLERKIAAADCHAGGDKRGEACAEQR